SVGNALEVAEAVACLQGGGPPETVALTLDLAEKVAGIPRTQLATWLTDGTAWRKFVAMVEAQGGDANALERITSSSVHQAPIIPDLPAPTSGPLKRLDAELIGRASIALGAGRTKATDRIDFAVGCDAIRKVGTTIQKGEPLLRIHARSESTLENALPMI